MRDRGVEVVETFHVRRGRQPVAAQFGQQLHVVFSLQTFGIAEPMAKQSQLSARGLARVEQPDRAGGAVAHVGVQRLAEFVLALLSRAKSELVM